MVPLLNGAAPAGCCSCGVPACFLLRPAVLQARRKLDGLRAGQTTAHHGKSLQAMIDWMPKIDALGGVIEIDLFGPKVR